MEITQDPDITMDDGIVRTWLVKNTNTHPMRVWVSGVLGVKLRNTVMQPQQQIHLATPPVLPEAVHEFRVDFEKS